MASIFARILAGELPAYSVAEDADHFAFLDVKPLKRGHTLVIPRAEIDYLFDMSEEAYGRLFAFARKVAIGLKKAVPCRKVGVAVVGLEVAHTHIHLVPMDDIADLNFKKPRLRFTDSEYAEIAASIQKHLQ
ncbi:MAG: HIT family protein [Spirochaetales bacterium]|nr:HIT family protein [Leptospiraceae bacterium]MCP5482556.1 HIT family protein [Spirochaetales bacterium]MCP5485146.1 HIT family protein [Spirochaetales bacterium]